MPEQSDRELLHLIEPAGSGRWQVVEGERDGALRCALRLLRLGRAGSDRGYQQEDQQSRVHLPFWSLIFPGLANAWHQRQATRNDADERDAPDEIPLPVRCTP